MRVESGDASNPIAGATEREYATTALSDESTFWVRVANDGGAINSDTATISIDASVPMIDTHPQASVFIDGEATQLTVSASSSAPILYQWYLGTSGDTSNPISGETNFDLSVTSLLEETDYWVEAKNDNGAVNSKTATLYLQQSLADWISQYDLSGNESLPSADKDGDKLSNLFEGFLGSSPLQSNTGNGLPSIELAADPNRLIITLQRSKRNKIGLKLHVSSNLNSWTSSDPEIQIVNADLFGDGLFELIQIPINVADNEQTIFVKLEAYEVL